MPGCQKLGSQPQLHAQHHRCRRAASSRILVCQQESMAAKLSSRSQMRQWERRTALCHHLPMACFGLNVISLKLKRRPDGIYSTLHWRPCSSLQKSSQAHRETTEVHWVPSHGPDPVKRSFAPAFSPSHPVLHVTP